MCIGQTDLLTVLGNMNDQTRDVNIVRHMLRRSCGRKFLDKSKDVHGCQYVLTSLTFYFSNIIFILKYNEKRIYEKSNFKHIVLNIISFSINIYDINKNLKRSLPISFSLSLVNILLINIE